MCSVDDIAAMILKGVENKQTLFGRVKRRLNTAKRSLIRLSKRTVSFAGWVLWIAGTSAVTLMGPVMFHYDKECQLLEMQQQLMQSQQAAVAPMLN